jgi:hypothetical protein
METLQSPTLLKSIEFSLGGTKVRPLRRAMYTEMYTFTHLRQFRKGSSQSRR